jgi:hypothetical protein
MEENPKHAVQEKGKSIAKVTNQEGKRKEK